MEAFVFSVNLLNQKGYGSRRSKVSILLTLQFDCDRFLFRDTLHSMISSFNHLMFQMVYFCLCGRASSGVKMSKSASVTHDLRDTKVPEQHS